MGAVLFKIYRVAQRCIYVFSASAIYTSVKALQLFSILANRRYTQSRFTNTHFFNSVSICPISTNFFTYIDAYLIICNAFVRFTLEHGSIISNPIYIKQYIINAIQKKGFCFCWCKSCMAYIQTHTTINWFNTAIQYTLVKNKKTKRLPIHLCTINLNPLLVYNILK